MITILGAKGSMGTRYQAILNWLGIAHNAYDLDSNKSIVEDAIYKSTGLIIATPTHTHTDLLQRYIGDCKKILCEKPVSKNTEEVEEVYRFASKEGTSLCVTMQYAEIAKNEDRGKESFYNYFRSGKDGLVWDCFQTIALAKGPVWLSNESPEWKCQINGEKLSLSSMDGAYVSFVKRWLNNNLEQNSNEMVEAHLRASEIAKDYYDGHSSNTNWYPGKV